MEHEEFEKKLMEMLLKGQDPVLGGLRKQYSDSLIESSRFTGAGFFTHFKVKTGTTPVAGGKTFQIGDMHASFNDIKVAFGFILFIEKGYLSFLEGYTLSSDVWPDDYSDVILSYDGPNGKRDFEKLKQNWSK